jgi:hypothetical protein
VRSGCSARCVRPSGHREQPRSKAQFEMQRLTAAMQRARHAPRADGAALDTTQLLRVLVNTRVATASCARPSGPPSIAISCWPAVRAVLEGPEGREERGRLASRAGGAVWDPIQGSWLGCSLPERAVRALLARQVRLGVAGSVFKSCSARARRRLCSVGVTRGGRRHSVLGMLAKFGRRAASFGDVAGCNVSIFGCFGARTVAMVPD